MTIRNARFSSRRKIVVTDAILVVSMEPCGEPSIAWLGDARHLPPPEAFAELISTITLSAATLCQLPYETMKRMVEMQRLPMITDAYIDPAILESGREP